MVKINLNYRINKNYIYSSFHSSFKLNLKYFSYFKFFFI